MRNVVWIYLILLIFSCKQKGNEIMHNIETSDSTNHLNHNNHHNALLLDSIPAKSYTPVILKFNEYVINSSKILINQEKYDLKSINENLEKYAITEDGILFDRSGVFYFFYKGNYGCLNNLISLDTISCDNINKYVILDKIAFHQPDRTHRRIPNNTHYWKMNKIQYSDLLDTIKKWNFNDKIVNLKMEYAPKGTLVCNGNSKIFNYNEIEILPDTYNR